MSAAAVFAYTLLAVLVVQVIPPTFSVIGGIIGARIKRKSSDRRKVLFERANAASEAHKPPKTSKASSSASLDKEWEHVGSNDSSEPAQQQQQSTQEDKFQGIIGFFHPFCNAGGGGERVLFAAVLATQKRYPRALCVVYTGDHDASKEQILSNARNRFNLRLDPSRVVFIYLSTRRWVLASTWPRFTLMGQSLGSLILGWEAFSLLAPDIFIDTMGYAFVLWLCKFLFPSIPTGAYVHYPTISTDMLSSLSDESSTKGVNAGQGHGMKGSLKQFYWGLFAGLYSGVGGSIDLVMTNSSWTQQHITSLWGPARKRNNKKYDISVVYPPCAVVEMQQKIAVNDAAEKKRRPDILYIAQFRPEKEHQAIIDAFASFIKANPTLKPSPRLVLVGSVRDDGDEKRVYKLRLQAQEIKDSVEFHINAKWAEVLDLLGRSSVGVNGMWNEHFGIGVVEYQAAGLISVVNDSGGPKADIVVPIDGKDTGFMASTVEQYAEAFKTALSLSPADTLAMRHRARKSSLRFAEDVFDKAWTQQIERLVRMC